MVATYLTRTVNLACLALVLLVAFALVSGKVSLVRVSGGSMAPALWPGDVCLVTQVAQPSVSDIVLLAEPGHESRVLHRVRALEGSALMTQGDANPVPDREPVAREAVLGRVSGILPVGRLVRRWQGASGR